MLLGEKYYVALQRPHVDLVTDPIERITSTSVVTAGGEVVDVDAIVLATGFETSRYLSGLDVIGIGGESLHDRWGSDPRAYLGVAVSGFPNFFMLYGPNTNQGANSIIYILEAGARLVASAVSRLARRGGFVDVRPEAEHRFNEAITLSWSGRSGRDATATTGRPRAASSRSGRTRNSTMHGRRGDYGRATGSISTDSRDPEIDYTADEFTILEIRVSVVDLVEPVSLRHHLVEPQLAGLVKPGQHRDVRWGIAGPEDGAAQVLVHQEKSCTLTLIGPIDRDGNPVSTHVPRA